MATKIPLVLSAGQVQQLQAGDSVDIAVDGRDISVDGATLDDIASGYTRGNALINGGFDFFQRTAPGTLTAVADDAYGPDRWNLLTQTASVQIQRATGDVYSVNAGRIKQNQASAQRMGLLQIVEAVDSKRFRGKTAILQARVKCSASQAIRIAILEWTGTADSVTSDVVKDWTSATYTVDNFFLATSLTITAVAAVTPDADTWTAISVSGTVSASCNNIIAFIWTEATAAQNVTLDVTESGLYFGSVVRSWSPRPVAHELAMCQRYYEKSYPLDTLIGTTGGVGLDAILAWGTTNAFPFSAFKVFKRVAPVVHCYSYAVGTIDKVTEYGTGAGEKAVTYTNQCERVFAIQSAAAFTNLDLLDFHWTAEAEL